MPYVPPASTGGGTPATAVTDGTTYGVATAVGTGTNYARQDHAHGSPATTKDTTVITGVLKGNGTAISAAVAGTDYLDPTGNGSGLTSLTVSQMSNAAPLASPTFTGVPAAPAPAAGTNTTQLATTAYAMSSAPNSSYRSLLDVTGSHIAARIAGTYGFGQGDPIAISGTGTLYPLNSIYIAATDYPTVNGLAPKLRIRAQLYVNDVAPTGNFTFALHPITRPATSGGAGLVIYTISAAVASSAATQIVAPAADSSNTVTGADFTLPADGHYIIGVVTTATVAASSHLHMSAILQMRNA